MKLPDPDTYLLHLECCTFYIDREDVSLWLLSYRTLTSDHYNYRYCSSAHACAALLREPVENDKDWTKLKERVPSLVLPKHAFDLASWFPTRDVTQWA